VVFSYSRHRKKLEDLARTAGARARAGTPAEAARGADALLLAVHWSRMDEVLAQAGNVSGKVLVSCSLPMSRDVGFEALDAGPLRIARYIEPFALLVARLAYEGGDGPELAYRFERFEA
jgi:predicted dinucleotide-binding enzyme